ncbi:hypothetical protein TNCV_260642 [Trichonephila clavipes]|nr:hypothetical protein TNCV_260642 [Trichonephila clavipes]
MLDITEPGCQTKKINQLQRKIEELKELLLLETANPPEEAELKKIYTNETRRTIWRLGNKNKTKVLGMAWQTLDDCLDVDTKGYSKDTSGFLSRGLSVDTLFPTTNGGLVQLFRMPIDELPKTVSERPELNEVQRLPGESKIQSWTPENRILLY